MRFRSTCNSSDASLLLGFNYPGGTARVVKVHDERAVDGGAMRDGSMCRTTGYTYDVKYIIGGGERRVDAQHIKSKVLASRQQLGEQRQEEQQRKKEERARAEAEARQLEEQRAERKRRARAELANRRAAKAKRVPSLKRVKVDICGIDGADLSVKTDHASRGDGHVSDNEDDCTLEGPQSNFDPEHAAKLRWLRDILLNRVPRSEAPDEINVNDIHTTVADCTDKPEAISQAQNYREATAELLHELERANFIMLVEDTVFLV